MKFWAPVLMLASLVYLGVFVEGRSVPGVGGWLSSVCGWAYVTYLVYSKNDCIHCCED